LKLEDKIDLILEKLDTFLGKNNHKAIEWIDVSSVADSKKLTTDAVRKQLKNGDFEEGIDFKYNGSKIQVHQGAIGRIQRKRRSLNG